MDNDLLKSAASEDHMEMMLMMQMDKLSEFSGGDATAYSEGSGDAGMMDFSSQNNGPVIPQASVSAFMNFPSNISFATAPQPNQDLSGLTFVPQTRWRDDIATGVGTDGRALVTESQKRNSVTAMREMIFRIAAMQPIHIDPESVKPPKRRNVKISKDPQSVAARHRRERISERIRTLQRLVPGGTKMDTASMLDEAIHYVKFLKNQVQSLERASSANRPSGGGGAGFPVPMNSGCSYLPISTKGYQSQNLQHFTGS